MKESRFDTPNRREVLRSLLGLAAALATPTAVLSGLDAPATQPAARDKWGELLPQRPLGRSGLTVTMLGLGGYHVSDWMNESTAQQVIEAAIAGGIRFFDTAASYGGGRSESRYGKLLVPKYRSEIFLMSKTAARDAAGARRELDDTLGRLNTDYLDLWQIHSLNSVNDTQRRLDQGVLDVFLDAQAKGKARHIGFTGHATPDAHLRMLDACKQKEDPLLTCQMPINITDPGYNSFILKVMPTLLERGFGVLAMKTLGNGGFFGGSGHGQSGPGERIVDRVSIADCINFALSLPISTLITGAHDVTMLQEKIDLARSFKDMTEQRRQELIAKVADMAGRKVEFYKA